MQLATIPAEGQTTHLAFIDIPDAAWSLITCKTPAQSLADLLTTSAISTLELRTFGYLITAIYEQPADRHVGNVTYWTTGDTNYLIGAEKLSAPPSIDQALAIWQRHFNAIEE